MTKLNVAEGSRTPVQYAIMAISTLIIFKDGKEVGRVVGAFPSHLSKAN